MHAGQLDPGLDREVRKRVGQQRPQVLGTDEFPARFLSRHTVKSEANSIYRKLGVSSRSQAVSRSVELGLLAG